MGEARRRGTFEERKAEAIKAGRDPEVNRRNRRSYRASIADQKAAYQAYIRQLIEYQLAAAKAKV